MSAEAGARRKAGLATAAVYAAFFAALGAWLPFWPLWLEDWGLTPGEIGAWLGVSMYLRIAFGVGLPWLADATGRRRATLAALGAAAALLFAAHAGAADRSLLFALTLLTAASLAGSIPIADALGAAAASRFRFDYARARSAGSAAFLLANLGCGAAIAVFGLDAALVWIVLSFALMAAAASIHPGGAPSAEPPPRPLEALGLMRSPAFLLAGAAVAFAQGAHAPLYALGSVHWRAQGIDEATIGALWAFGVALETALMLTFGGRIIARLGAPGALALACGTGVIRWSIMAFDPPLGALWAIQASHALTFAPAHLALVAFVSTATPARLTASAQGLIGGAAVGVAMAGGTVTSGWLYPAFGGGVYWIGAAFALAGLVSALALGRIWPGRGTPG